MFDANLGTRVLEIWVDEERDEEIGRVALPDLGQKLHRWRRFRNSGSSDNSEFGVEDGSRWVKNLERMSMGVAYRNWVIIYDLFLIC